MNGLNSTSAESNQNDENNASNGENVSLWSRSSPEKIIRYYEQLGDWNRTLPKTDYTYSPVSKYYNKEIAPGIPTLPNMSRNPISSEHNYSNNDSDNINNTRARFNPLPGYLYYCNYGPDFALDEQNNTLIHSTKDHVAESVYSSIVSKTLTIFILVFRWLHIIQIFQTTLDICNFRYFSYFYSRISNSITNSEIRQRTKFIYLLVTFLGIVALGFYLTQNTKSENLLISNIPMYVDNVADNTMLRIHKLTETVSIRAYFSKIIFMVQDIIQSGIYVPWLLIKTLFNSLADIITSSGLLLFSPIWYIINLLPDASRSLFNHPVEQEMARDLNYTKLAEVLLTTEEFKKMIESQSYGSFAESPFNKINLDISATELKNIMEHSKYTSSNPALDIFLSEIINTTVVENTILKYTEDIMQKILQQKQFTLLKDLEVKMNAKYVTEDRLNDIVNSLSQNLTESVTQDLKNMVNQFLKHSEKDLYSHVEKHFSQSTTELSLVNMTLFEIYVNQSIQRALRVYDADKTGMVDYALETSGGVILNTRCTETMKSPISFTVLNIPLWRMQTNPRIVIQPGVHPGQCWAFSGSVGFLVIQLSQPIYVTGFTLEHIPRSLAPNGIIDSSPKEFSVWGLFHETKLDTQVFLGRFTYNTDENSFQYFQAEKSEIPFQIVELRVESNHGKIEYTCIYRFRVHGIPKHY